jgi:hypothetical protein
MFALAETSDDRLQEVRSRIVQSTDYFLKHGVSDPAAAYQQAIVALGKAVRHQALVMGFSDTFAVNRRSPGAADAEGEGRGRRRARSWDYGFRP